MVIVRHVRKIRGDLRISLSFTEIRFISAGSQEIKRMTADSYTSLFILIVAITYVEGARGEPVAHLAGKSLNEVCAKDYYSGFPDGHERCTPICHLTGQVHPTYAGIQSYITYIS